MQPRQPNSPTAPKHPKLPQNQMVFEIFRNSTSSTTTTTALNAQHHQSPPRQKTKPKKLSLVNTLSQYRKVCNRYPREEKTPPPNSLQKLISPNDRSFSPKPTRELQENASWRRFIHTPRTHTLQR
ncbi:hypothetical protein M758_UG100700 [Ceratodon purpureus]|nr:hypothetical protein M758_UG100700 [Ceratodon purpureus]